ncbi:MAG TPA: peptidylprolyl isomerase [Oscillospiraceae bacterium]|nr:peptidylprolyl isomerase [Oscillospiraceae bacterium]HNW05143.1 peptidylprolyl isomerase [Oscillospiraceae bacterium]
MVIIEMADGGIIKIELDKKAAPLTCENFELLAGTGFYDGLVFHRVIKGFMIQGGDPYGADPMKAGMGGSGITVKGEFAANGWENPISHLRGVVSMARSQSPNSASSQFFIVHEDSTFLDGQYAAFGRVVEGMDVVDAVAESAVRNERPIYAKKMKRVYLADE